MLARVEPRSRPRPEGFQLLKIEGPKGEAEVGRFANGLRCGIDPARSLERRVEVPGLLLSGGSRLGDGDLLNGL